jgi:hypothetical protein
MTEGVTQVPDVESAADERKKSGRGRAVTTIVLIVLASLLLPFAGLTVWVRNMMLSTDRYTTTIGPVAEDPVVQEAVATKVSIAVANELDIAKRAKDALPPKAEFLAGPIATGATQLVHNATLKIVQSHQFQTLWDKANERAHNQLVGALTGRDSARLKNDDGKVVLQLGPLAVKVAEQLKRIGIGLPSDIDVNRMNVRFVLIDSADLKSIQTYTKILDKLAWLLPILAILLYAIAIAIAPRKRVAVARTGIGITVAMVVAVIGYGLIRTLYLDSLPGPGKHEAGAVIYDTVTRYVQRGFRILLVIGVLIWLIAWLAGPSRPAVAVRRQWNRMFDKGDGTGTVGPITQWVADHVGLLRGLLLAVLGLLLIAWENPTGKVVLLLIVIGLVGLLVIQLLAAGAKRADAPDAVDDVDADVPATT